MPPRIDKGKTAIQNAKSSQKAVVKKPLTTPERLKRLFTSLCAQIDGGHFGNAIKTCDKVLRLEPKDDDALRTKLFLLLQTEDYHGALALIDSHGSDKLQHAFEKAYSLYRLQREPEAREILSAIKEENGDSRGVAHLEAQLNYREGSYQAAFELYSDLLDTAEPDTEEHSDVLTNLQASQRHLDFIETEFLHVLGALPSSIASSIEFAPPPTQVTSTIQAIVPPVSQGLGPDAKKESVVPKKVRVSRVPAGVVPGVTPPPDPERWLKKTERSSYGQGRKRKGGGGATQGSASVETPTGRSTPIPAAKTVGGKGKKRK